MINSIENRLNRVWDIWNVCIFSNNFCSDEIILDKELKTNYFGDIVDYFRDTLKIVFSDKKKSNYEEKFSFTISFLQSIYVQQDFIIEMLEMFKTGVEKTDLVKDETYKVNRDLRNELIGHPIRKRSKKLISSAFFCCQDNDNEIQYLLYRRDNEFKSELKKYKIEEIIKRHQDFLEKYMDVILHKLKQILSDFLPKLADLEKDIEKQDFNNVLSRADRYFRSFLDSSFINDKEFLLQIYQKKEEHIRYRKYLELFHEDLIEAIVESREYINSILEEDNWDNHEKDYSIPKVKFIKFPEENSEKVENETKESILIDASTFGSNQTPLLTYEFGKLAAQSNFDMNSRLLEAKCSDNQLVLSEIEHMRENETNEIEYYSALALIKHQLSSKGLL